jgi:hypothetical protein
MTSLAKSSELEPGDIVFFDGSHRSFTNSDANVFFLAGCYVSDHTDLPAPIDRIWNTPELADVERHGAAFWLEISRKSG